MSRHHVIPWIARPDLQAFAQPAASSSGYVVKDPVRNEFYQFSPTEYFFLNLLRTPQSFESLIEKASHELGKTYSITEIRALLKRLAFENLIVSQTFGDGARLLSQKELEGRNAWKQRIFGILSLNLGGVHPGRWLPWFKPFGQLIFNPVTLFLFSVGFIATLGFAVLSFDSLTRLAPSLSELTSPTVLIAVLIGFCIAKVLHELGHATACQHYGRECSEIGIIMLVFFPCLYCDVSDMWSERSRWKRIMVTLAGVWVELAIAVVCFWIWYLTVPGLVHSVCYSLMLITSINTLFINGNPLMRFDGYYALVDLVNRPNLSAMANQTLQESLARVFYRQPPNSLEDRSSTFLLLYAVLAKVYRTLILFAIGFGIWSFFDYQGLRSMGGVVVTLLMSTVLVPMAMGWFLSARRMLTSNDPMNSIRWPGLILVCGFGIAIVWSLTSFEFSQRVWGTARLQLSRPQYLFANWSGRFAAHAENGHQVRQGDLIGKIETLELEDDYLSLDSQLQDVRQNLNLILIKSDGISSAARAEFWKQREGNLVRQLEENRQRLVDLEIRAPADGQLVASHFGVPPSLVEMLPQKFGTVFDLENQGCRVNRGDLIGYVGEPEKFRGVMRVAQSEIELVQVGQSVKVAVPYHSTPLMGHVIDISIEDHLENHQTSANNSANSELPHVSYQVIFEIDRTPGLNIGSSCQVIILGPQTSLFRFVGRWLRNSFWF